MKVDWTIISHYISQSFSSWMVGRICTMSLGLKGLNVFYYSLIITCMFCANHKVGEVFEFSREDFGLWTLPERIWNPFKVRHVVQIESSGWWLSSWIINESYNESFEFCTVAYSKNFWRASGQSNLTYKRLAVTKAWFSYNRNITICSLADLGFWLQLSPHLWSASRCSSTWCWSLFVPRSYRSLVGFVRGLILS